MVKDGAVYQNEKPQHSVNLLQERSLRVTDVRAVAKDAVEITLEALDNEALHFHPGQFLTLNIEIDGQKVKRPYSICSAASDTTSVRVGVRQIENGLVSTYLNQSIKPGDVIGAYGPSGITDSSSINQCRMLFVSRAGVGSPRRFLFCDTFSKRTHKARLY